MNIRWELIQKINRYYIMQQYILKESKGNRLQKENGITLSHVTNCKCGNTGDTVLSQCVRKTFEKNFSVKWSIFNVKKPVNNFTVSKINKSNALVIGGGGLFLPDTNKNNISGWQWAVSEKLLNKIHVPILVYSVGYNYFKGQECNELFQKNLTLLCEKSNFFGLRNYGSINTIKNLVPDHLKYKIIYQPCTTTVIRKIYTNLPPKVRGRKIAINMAFDRENMRYGEKKELILNQVAEFTEALTKKGYEIFLVYHSNTDKKFYSYLKKYNIKFTVKDLINAYPETVYDFYNQIDLVLGMRGHAQMIPFGLNCEIISMGTHDKMRWFLDDIDAIDWYVDLNECPEKLSQILMDKFTHIHELHPDDTQKRLLEQQEKLWAITKENMQLIEKIVYSNSPNKMKE